MPTSVAASCWNSISLPARRTHSPVEVSASPRMREAHAGVPQDRDEGARDLLARADRTTAPSRRRTGSRGRPHRAAVATTRHVEAARPVAARVRRQAPGVALRLVGVEHRLQLVRELAVHHHPVLAHAVEARQVLELDRAGGLAVAAGRAGPQRVLADDVADERRQRVLSAFARRRSPRAARAGGASGCRCTHFSDSGLPVRNVGQASLQRPHSVQVKASSPSFQVRSRAVRTPTCRSRLGVVAHQLARGRPSARALAGRPRRKIQRRQRGDDVEVLAGRQQHEERRTRRPSASSSDAGSRRAARPATAPRTPTASALPTKRERRARGAIAGIASRRTARSGSRRTRSR